MSEPKFEDKQFSLSDEDLGTVIKALRFWQNRNYILKCTENTPVNSEVQRIISFAYKSWDDNPDDDDKESLYDKAVDRLIDKLV